MQERLNEGTGFEFLRDSELLLRDSFAIRSVGPYASASEVIAGAQRMASSSKKRGEARG